MKYTSYVIFIIIILLAYACNNKVSDEQNRNRESDKSTTAGIVELNQAQIKTAGILMGNLQSDTISSVVDANGYVELLPNNRATINPPINGLIENIKCIEGKPVKKGEPLFVLRHPDIIELQKEYIRSINEFNIARQDVERQKILSESNVAARKQYEQAQATFQIAKAQKNAVAEQLLFIGIIPDDVENGRILNTVSVIAPFSGTVSKIYSHKGQLVTPGESMAELINADKLLLKLNIFEQDVNKVKVNQKLTFTIPSFSNSKTYLGTVSFVGKDIDAETRTVQVTSVLSSYPELIPGVYAEAKILCNPKIAWVLPDESIIKDVDGEYVFRLESDSVMTNNADVQRFIKMNVTTGVSENGYTEITNESVPENSVFVTKGAYYLKSEMNKSEGVDD
ncbi:MAG: efflux RND transporter periplasmic adaptor subunit [Porphyromonadaceae bacterium]|nr:efflux RND transporter periplasmic adaptor subunit [Porphyromonadaceae bacterium]